MKIFSYILKKQNIALEQKNKGYLSYQLNKSKVKAKGNLLM